MYTKFGKIIRGTNFKFNKYRKLNASIELTSKNCTSNWPDSMDHLGYHLGFVKFALYGTCVQFINSIYANVLYLCLSLNQVEHSYFIPQSRWVTNHYKWVVWKLACYERCHLAKSFGNFLTVSNVLEELKYRYSYL